MLNRYYNGSELAQLRLANNRIYGSPAASLNKHANNLNNLKGHYGEVIIGNLLNLLTVETPGAYVCHSVAFIDNKQGETDHVLIYKDRIILVETKAFSGYTSYRVNKEGVLKASYGNGRGRRVDDSNVYNKVAYYQEQFPHRKVQAIIAIARDNIKTWSENGRYKVASLDNIMQILRSIMDEADEVKEPAWTAVKQFASMCVKPFDTTTDTRPVTVAVAPEEDLYSPEVRAGKQSYSNRPLALRH